VDVEGDHNNPLVLANDQTMRGGIVDPKANRAHRASYSELHDGQNERSARLCGACHDIVTESGVHLERTFAEWKTSVTARPEGLQTCISCHMRGRDGIAADDPASGVSERRIHSHLFEGVDMALTDFPGKEIQQRAIECLLNASVVARICAEPGGTFEVSLEANVGHAWPSGATPDRRAWVQFVAYDADDAVIFQSGVIPDGEVVDEKPGDPGYDPNLWVLRDRIFDERGEEVHMFWEAAPSETHPDGVLGSLLPVATTLGVPHSRSRVYQVLPPPERVEIQVQIRAMGLDVLQDLVDSGDLDAAVSSEIPTHVLHGSRVTWSRAADRFSCVSKPGRNPIDCRYECVLDPEADGCR
jgi:hypothetical protein